MAQVATQLRPSTSAPGDGSRTITVLEVQPLPEDLATHDGGADNSDVGSLRLRGARRNRPHVAWDEDVVDNEGCGRKKSKICCIYHKPRKFDESSSEDDSSDSGSDSPCDHDHHHHSGGRRQSPQRSEPRENEGADGAAVHQLEDEETERNAYEVRRGTKKSKKGKMKAS